MKLRRNSKPYKVIQYLLAAGSILLFSAASPAGGARIAHDIVKLYFRKRRFEREKFLRDLKNLQTRQLLDYHELPDGSIKLVLRRAGKNLRLAYHLDGLRLDTRRPWDGRWRMIVFDIPDSKKGARDALRRKLQELGCYRLQESVLLVPYECEHEIDFLCTVFDINRNHVLLLYVSGFEGEEKLKHHFNL